MVTVCNQSPVEFTKLYCYTHNVLSQVLRWCEMMLPVLDALRAAVNLSFVPALSGTKYN